MEQNHLAPMECLRAEHAVIAELLELMKQEQASLIAADVDALTRLTEQKNQLVQRASALAQQRHAALAAAGFAAREEGMQDWLANVSRDDVRQAWEKLLDITRSAKEINRVNGVLINRQMANTHNALQALQPPSSNGTAGQHLYGPSGHSTLGQGSRRLVVG